MLPRFSLTKGYNDRQRLQIQGEFQHPHWVAYLFAGLSNLKISVIGGNAKRGAARDWEAHFDLDFSGCTLTPEKIDYQELSTRPPALAFAEPKLSEFQVVRRGDQNLDVCLQGPDKIGFLGRILVKIALLSLFPCELEIDTVAGRIRDRIVFCGIGGQPPRVSVERSLESLLQPLVVSS